jgi:hypothetical protein
MHPRNMKKNRVVAEQTSISDNFKVKKSLGVSDFNFDRIDNSIPSLKKGEPISGIESKLTTDLSQKITKPVGG